MGNSATVGIGDKLVTTYPFTEISDEWKTTIKDALNHVCSARVAIDSTDIPCEGHGETASRGRLRHGETEVALVDAGALTKVSKRKGEVALEVAHRKETSNTCCAILKVRAMPVPLKRISLTIPLTGGSIHFEANVDADLYGMHYNRACQLRCEPDRMTGSVDLVLDGKVSGTVKVGPFDLAEASLELEDFRVKMGDFDLTCGQDVKLG